MNARVTYIYKHTCFTLPTKKAKPLHTIDSTQAISMICLGSWSGKKQRDEIMLRYNFKILMFKPPFKTKIPLYLSRLQYYNTTSFYLGFYNCLL